MSRRKTKPKRETTPDPLYKDVTVARFINKLTWDGKKSVAQQIVYSALDDLSGKVQGEESLTIFKKAIDNLKPNLEVRSRRVGGSTYQIPVEVRPNRRLALAMRWLIGYARDRNEKTMGQRVAAEVLDAYNNRGNAIKKREDVHKMAEANKAFAHYNW